jgi:glycosyltransferase involved in cell wall biosynthesis
MNILQVVPRFPPAIGGMEEHVYRISLELVKRGHKVTIITSNEVDGKIYACKQEAIQGIQVYRCPLFMPKIFREFWLIPDILGVFQHLKAEVVHAHGYRCLSSCTAIYLAHLKHIPTVFTPHGIYPKRTFANMVIKSLFDHTLGRLLLNFSDRIIALTEHNRQLLLQLGAPNEKISFVPNGVNLTEYVNLQRSKKVLHELHTDGPVLLYVGRIDWNKKLEKVASSMPLILKQFPSAKFVIVGPDYANYGSSLISLAGKLNVENSLVITGKVSREKLLEFYSIADIFLLPSSYEGFGLSMLEAMSSKIPVIVSSSGGPGDILSHGVNAILLKNVTPREIFNAVYVILTDHNLRESIVKNAFELVKRRYTWKTVVTKLEMVYGQLMR